jgi:hypothetical protein
MSRDFKGEERVQENLENLLRNGKKN